MRGRDFTQTALFSTKPLNRRIPHNHPLRKLRVIVDFALREMDSDFEAMYDATRGRESIPPEQLLRAMLVQILFSVRSERQLMEQMEYNLLFRWFVGLEMDQEVWNHSTFSANRCRLLNHDVARKFFDQVLAVARSQALLSTEHFSVDGTLIEAMGSLKSIVPRASAAAASPESVPPSTGPTSDAEVPTEQAVASEQALPAAAEPAPSAPVVANPTPESARPEAQGRNGWVDFKGKERRNDTHVSTTDPDAKLYCKGAHQTTELSWMGHALMENRNGLLCDVTLTPATGTAEREAAEAMAQRSIHVRGATLGSDKGYDVKAHVAALKKQGVRAHAAQNNKGRKSAIDGRTACSKGYKASQKFRKRIEEFFGWVKCVGNLRKSKFFGAERTEMAFVMAAAGYNLVRMMGLFGWRIVTPAGEVRPA